MEAPLFVLRKRCQRNSITATGLCNSFSAAASHSAARLTNGDGCKIMQLSDDLCLNYKRI